MLVKSDGNCFCSFFLPFLNKGVISAHFHLLGNWPTAKDLLINAHIDGERADAHSLKMCGDKPSGPGDLEAFRFFNSCSISLTEQ